MITIRRICDTSPVFSFAAFVLLMHPIHPLFTPPPYYTLHYPRADPALCAIRDLWLLPILGHLDEYALVLAPHRTNQHRKPGHIRSVFA